MRSVASAVRRPYSIWLLIICPTVILCAGIGVEFRVRAGDGDTSQSAYLMSTFDGRLQDGLRYVWSTDGYKWERIPGIFLQPTVGKKIMRDPSICRGPDGRWHLVWTAGWQGTDGFGYAWSWDLVKWNDERYIRVMAHEPEVVNVWAPELYYDDQTGQFIICWASTVPGRFPHGTEDPRNNHRLYYTITRDFSTFAPARLFFDPGYSVIDGFVLKDSGRFVLLFKDNTRPNLNIRVAFGPSPTGPWSQVSPPITVRFTEGPSALRIGRFWVIYFEHYRQNRYMAMRTSDFRSFEEVTYLMDFPDRLKHGTAFKIDREELRRLLEASKYNGNGSS